MGLVGKLGQPREGEPPRFALVFREDVGIELLQRRIRLLLAGDRGLRVLVVKARAVERLMHVARLHLSARHLTAERKDDDHVERDVGEDGDPQPEHNRPLLGHDARERRHGRPPRPAGVCCPGV